MLFLSLLFFLASIISFALWVFVKADKEGNVAPVLYGSISGFIFSIILFILSTVIVIDSGNVGVPVLFGSVQNEQYKEGMHFINPLYQIHQMSIRTENYSTHEQPVIVRSSNGLQMPVDISVPYRLTPNNASWVYQNLGDAYISKVLKPSLYTAARRAASVYTSEELYSTKRDEFALKTQQYLEEELNKILNDNYKGEFIPKHILMVSQVLIGHIGIPETVKNAIESKLKADQEQQAMEFQIMKEKKEAERKTIEAEGIQKFQEIVSKGIDDRLLKWKGIDATLKLAESNNSKIVIIGSGKDGLPLILGNSDSK